MLHMITRSTSPRCFFKRKLFRMFCNSQGLRKLLEVEKSLNHEPPAENKENPSHKTTARHITCRTLWTTVVRHVFVHHWPQTPRNLSKRNCWIGWKWEVFVSPSCSSSLVPPKAITFLLGVNFLDATNNLLDLVFESDYEPRVLDDTFTTTNVEFKDINFWVPLRKIIHKPSISRN